MAQYWKSDEMLAQQSQFADEAFTFLLKFAKVDTVSTRDINKYTGSSLCTRQVCETLIILSYILRPSYRKAHLGVIRLIRNAEDFERYIGSNQIPKDNHYIFNFLIWVCFIFDVTLCCLRNNMDCIERAVLCLTFYPDMPYFHIQGGWIELYKICDVYSKPYDVVYPIIVQELPMQQVLEPFFCCFKSMLESNNSLKIPYSPAMLLIRKIINNLLKQYELVVNLNPLSVMGKYKIQKRFTKVSSQISTLKVSPENMLPETRTQVNSLRTSPENVSPINRPLKTSPETRQQIASTETSPANVSQIPSPLLFSHMVRQQKISPKSNHQQLKNIAKTMNKTEEDMVTVLPNSFGKTIISAAAALSALDETENFSSNEYSLPDKNETISLYESSPQVDEAKWIPIIKNEHFNEIKAVQEATNFDHKHDLIHSASTVTTNMRNINIIVDNVKRGNYTHVGNGVCIVFPSGFSTDDISKVIKTYFKEQFNDTSSSSNNAIPSLAELCTWVFETRVRQESKATAPDFDLAAEESF